MAKAKTKPAAPRKPRDPQTVRRIRRIVMHSCILTVVLAGSAVGYRYLDHYVDKTLVFPSEPPRVVLKDRPVWMSDSLEKRITDRLRPRAAYSPFDQRPLESVVTLLQADRDVAPWVKQLNQVRRVFGKSPGDTIEVDCEWRAPIALVEWGQYYWYVDGEGYKLPVQFSADQLPRVLKRSDGTLNTRIITGVKKPPVESGQKWPGDDLLAGIDLVNYLADRPYAQRIVKIDVTNFGGRVDPREAQLVLVTMDNTQVRWGRPVNAKDFFIEAAPEKKLAHMQEIYAEFGRVDANKAWVDLRFDDVIKPADPPQVDANSGQ